MLPIEIDRNYIAEIFRAEAEENLRAMEEAFVVLESTPGDVETLKAVFRAAHTLKGSAAGLGFTSLSRFAHTVEDVLDRLRSGTSVLTTPLDQPQDDRWRRVSLNDMPMQIRVG